jgi:DNA-directed RNA polymerase subunit RPC12/RpoP
MEIQFTLKKCGHCKKEFRPQGGRQVYCNSCRKDFAKPLSKQRNPKIARVKRAKRIVEARKSIIPLCLSAPVFDPYLNDLVRYSGATWLEVFKCRDSIQQSL